MHVHCFFRPIQCLLFKSCSSRPTRKARIQCWYFLRCCPKGKILWHRHSLVSGDRVGLYKNFHIIAILDLRLIKKSWYKLYFHTWISCKDLRIIFSIVICEHTSSICDIFYFLSLHEDLVAVIGPMSLRTGGFGINVKLKLLLLLSSIQNLFVLKMRRVSRSSSMFSMNTGHSKLIWVRSCSCVITRRVSATLAQKKKKKKRICNGQRWFF